MVAMLAFGGTYAYFTATASQASGSATTGLVSLAANSQSITLTANPVPGDTIFSGDIAYTNDSTVETFVYVQFAASFAGQTVSDVLTITTGDVNWTAGTGAEGNGIPVGTYYRKLAASPNTTFPVSIVFKSSVTENNAQADTSTLTYMGKAITVTVQAASIQTAHLSGADDPAKAVAGLALVDFDDTTNSAPNS